VGTNCGLVKQKNIQLVFIASPLRTQHYLQQPAMYEVRTPRYLQQPAMFEVRTPRYLQQPAMFEVRTPR
jgi:hypothetical protein